jgi:hypothetical protein
LIFFLLIFFNLFLIFFLNFLQIHNHFLYLFFDPEFVAFFTEPLTKVLVTTGYYEGSKKIEIIDLEDPTNVCQPSFLADYPIDQVSGASGGLLTNNNALICGGKVDGERLDDCFAINENGIKNGSRLTLPRAWPASVVWNSTTMWLTGGYSVNPGDTKSTEFVQLTGTTLGPDLPLEVSSHCLVSLNDTTVLLIGGYLHNGTTSKGTFFYNTDHKTWTDGPSLTIGRSGHSCALFKSPQHDHTDTVIVTGGKNAGSIDSTEFLNLESNSWQSGKGQLNSNPQHSGVAVSGNLCSRSESIQNYSFKLNCTLYRLWFFVCL